MRTFPSKTRGPDFAVKIGARRLYPIQYWGDPNDIHILLGGLKDNYVISIPWDTIKQVVAAKTLWRIRPFKRMPFLTRAKLKRLVDRELVPRTWGSQQEVT